MITIGVITRGKYGVRLIENIKKNSDLRVIPDSIPETLPDLIDEPGKFAASLDRNVFSCDLVITYTLHPDLTPEIVRLSGENGASAVIIAGGRAGAGSQAELQGLSEKYNIHVEVHEICCDIEKCGNSVVDELASFFGRPELEISTEGGIITGVKVIRGAPCGSTWHAGKGLEGTGIKEAPAKAGLLVQQYPCRAIRGIKGGIHRAAELHKKAVERALEVE